MEAHKIKEIISSPIAAEVQSESPKCAKDSEITSNFSLPHSVCLVSDKAGRAGK